MTAQNSAGLITDSSIDLIYQSPPYPISTGRAYGTFTDADLISLLMKCAPDWHRGLKDTGSLVLNLKDCWLPKSVTGGEPELSLYIEKLLIALKEDAKFHFAGRHFWRNPSCGPTTPFVTVRKIRAANDTEHMLWLSKTRTPYADTTQVMEPAKKSTVDTYLRKARAKQLNRVGESGQNNIFEEQVAKALRGDQIMVLPRTVQTFSNADPQTKLKVLLAEAGLPAHPAKMPLELAKWWISFLTKPAGEVRDFFAGSNTTGLAAEQLGRRWACCDRSLAYLMGSSLRFPADQVNFMPVGAVA
jgi:site-specific DNA-methyltransferase (cytosine-N4-specific)